MQDYVVNMLKLAWDMAADSRMTRFTILNGQQPELQPYVI